MKVPMYVSITALGEGSVMWAEMDENASSENKHQDMMDEVS